MKSTGRLRYTTSPAGWCNEKWLLHVSLLSCGLLKNGAVFFSLPLKNWGLLNWGTYQHINISTSQSLGLGAYAGYATLFLDICDTRSDEGMDAERTWRVDDSTTRQGQLLAGRGDCHAIVMEMILGIARKTRNDGFSQQIWWIVSHIYIYIHKTKPGVDNWLVIIIQNHDSFLPWVA